MKISTLMPSWLLTLASLFFLYTRLPVYFYPLEFVRPLMTLWLILFLLFLPAYWITRKWNWAGLLLVVFVLGFFTSNDFAYAYSITVITILILLWATDKYLLKRRPRTRQIYLVVNAVSLIAILLSLFNAFPMLNTIPFSYYGSTWDVVHSRKYVKLDLSSDTRPDIYYIVLDEYGRSDILKQFYGFDNKEFISFLEKKGFVLPDKSQANYPRTALSVTSALNMDYVSNFAPHLEKSSLWWLMSPWLDHSLARTSLEKIGYSSVSISSEWSITDNPTTDYYLKSHPVILTEFERYILLKTPLRTLLPALQGLASVPTYASHRRSQLYEFDALAKSASIPGPKFVFAHILMPHPPFVFSSTGNPIDPKYPFSLSDSDAPNFALTPEQYRKGYVEQTMFLNSQLEVLIDKILKNSKRPPIIILQADHGPRLHTDFASAENTCLVETFSTFSAYYLPGLKAGAVPADITPVNIFRVVFNDYFDANLPLLENAEYYPGHGGGFYSFEDVTQRIDSHDNCHLE